MKKVSNIIGFRQKPADSQGPPQARRFFYCFFSHIIHKHEVFFIAICLFHIIHKHEGYNFCDRCHEELYDPRVRNDSRSKLWSIISFFFFFFFWGGGGLPLKRIFYSWSELWTQAWLGISGGGEIARSKRKGQNKKICQIDHKLKMCCLAFKQIGKIGFVSKSLHS